MRQAATFYWRRLQCAGTRKQAGAYHPIPALMFDALGVPGLRFEVGKIDVYDNDEIPFRKWAEEKSLE